MGGGCGGEGSVVLVMLMGFARLEHLLFAWTKHFKRMLVPGKVVRHVAETG